MLYKQKKKHNYPKTYFEAQYQNSLYVVITLMPQSSKNKNE